MDEPLPELPSQVTLEEAFRAAYHLTAAYVALEDAPDVGLVLFLQYLRSDPARWGDWRSAVSAALVDDEVGSPFGWGV